LDVSESILRGKTPAALLEMCNSVVGDATPIPTRLLLTTRSFLLYAPIMTRLSLNTSKTGNPAIVLTDIKLSLRSSVTLNNTPLTPVALNIELPDIVDVTSNLAVGVVVFTPIAAEALSKTMELAIVVVPVNLERYPAVPPGLTPVAPCAPCAPDVPEEPFDP
jgi:hypothetical protein